MEGARPRAPWRVGNGCREFGVEWVTKGSLRSFEDVGGFGLHFGEGEEFFAEVFERRAEVVGFVVKGHPHGMREQRGLFFHRATHPDGMFFIGSSAGGAQRE